MRSGLTPLHEAARSGTKDFVALLIKKGAKVNPQIKVKNCLDPDYDAQDATPLDLARKRDDIEIIALLEIRGGRSGQEKAPAKN